MTEFLLRIPDDLYRTLKEIAKKEDRSINGQLLHILKKFIESYNKQQR